MISYQESNDGDKKYPLSTERFKADIEILQTW